MSILRTTFFTAILAACNTKEDPNVIKNEFEPPLTNCVRAITKLRNAVKAIKILDDNRHIDENEGPFVNLLNLNTACSSLMDSAKAALDETFDVCDEEDLLDDGAGQDIILLLTTQQNLLVGQTICPK